MVRLQWKAKLIFKTGYVKGGFSLKSILTRTQGVEESQRKIEKKGFVFFRQVLRFRPESSFSKGKKKKDCYESKGKGTEV